MMIYYIDYILINHMVDDLQRNFIQSPIENSELIGCSGSGKTISIIRKVKRHVDIGELLSNEFLIITFGNPQNIISTNSTLFNNDNVKKFSIFVDIIIQKLLNKRCSHLNIASLSILNFLEKCNTNFSKLYKINFLNCVKLLVVDDAQNISEIQKKLLVELKKYFKFKIVISCDQTQNFNRYATSFDYNVYYLKNNYRSNEKIFKFVENFNPLGKNNPTVDYIKNNCNIFDSVTSEIKNISKYKSSALITPYLLHGDQLDVIHKFKKLTSKMSDKIKFVTVNDSIGEEFDNIYLVGFDYVNKSETMRYLLYCALCRAKNKINIWKNDIESKTQNFCKYNNCNDKDILECFEYKIKNIKFFNNFTNTTTNLVGLTNNDGIILRDFIKYSFEYYYSLLNLKNIKFLDDLEIFLKVYNKNGIMCDCDISILSSFLNKNNSCLYSPISYGIMLKNIHKYDNSEWKIFKKISKFKFPKNALIGLTTEVLTGLENSINNIKNNINVATNIFNICKYIHPNCKSISDTILDQLMSRVINIVLNCKTKIKFNQKVKHPNINKMYVIDIIIDDTIVFFANNSMHNDSLCDENIMKGLILYHWLDPLWKNIKKFEIWNIISGIKHVVNFETFLHSFDLTLLFSKKFNIKLENVILIYDLETTGLNVQHCEIIERYIHELNHDCEVSSGLIKPRSKIPTIVTKITGITNNDVRSAENIKIFKNELCNILFHCDKPIFIAHNGNVFDHRIIRKMIGSTQILDCAFLDSRIIIRQMSNCKIGIESLSEIYKIIMGENFSGKIHRAKADVIMILDIFKKLKIDSNFITKII